MVVCDNRKQFKQKRHRVILVQAYIRMKLQRPKYLKALQEKQKLGHIAYQMQSLQERLHDEQRRNAEMKKERDSGLRDSMLYAETGGTRSRGKSTAHIWMADADGMLNELNEEATRLRKKNEDLKAANSNIKNENEKLRSEKEVVAANFHVKIRTLEDTVRCMEVSLVLLNLDYWN